MRSAKTRLLFFLERGNFCSGASLIVAPLFSSRKILEAALNLKEPVPAEDAGDKVAGIASVDCEPDAPE